MLSTGVIFALLPEFGQIIHWGLSTLLKHPLAFAGRKSWVPTNGWRFLGVMYPLSSPRVVTSFFLLQNQLPSQSLLSPIQRDPAWGWFVSTFVPKLAHFSGLSCIRYKAAGKAKGINTVINRNRGPYKHFLLN